MKVEKQIKILIIFRIFDPKYFTLRLEKRKKTEYRTKYKNYFSWIPLLYKGNEKWHKS